MHDDRTYHKSGSESESEDGDRLSGGTSNTFTSSSARCTSNDVLLAEKRWVQERMLAANIILSEAGDHTLAGSDASVTIFVRVLAKDIRVRVSVSSGSPSFARESRRFLQKWPAMHHGRLRGDHITDARLAGCYAREAVAVVGGELIGGGGAA